MSSSDLSIKFVGTGGAFDWEYGNSAAIVRVGGQSILIDCGPSIYASLRSLELVDTIDAVILTHLHGDHVGSLFSLLVHRAAVFPSRRLTLYYPTSRFGKEVRAFLATSMEVPEEFVDMRPLEHLPNVGYLDTTGRHSATLSSFAYYFCDPDRSTLIYYSGDLGDVSVTTEFLVARTERDILVLHDMNWKPGPAHVYFMDLQDALRGYTVYGYHVDPRSLPVTCKIPTVAGSRELMLRSTP